MPHFFTFDCESLGLYGTTFAAGWVVTDATGKRLTEGIVSCPLPSVFRRGLATDAADIAWCEENVVPTLPPTTLQKPLHVRAGFAGAVAAASGMADTHGEKLLLAADCPFPVETNFLRWINDDIEGGLILPVFAFATYPFIDVASVLLARGYDPIATYPRLPDELPAHNPLNDARQSSRILHQVLAGGDPNVLPEG